MIQRVTSFATYAFLLEHNNLHICMGCKKSERRLDVLDRGPEALVKILHCAISA